MTIAEFFRQLVAIIAAWIAVASAPIAAPTAVPTMAPTPPPAPTIIIDEPPGVTVKVATDGCVDASTCPYGRKLANYYWAPTRTIVLAPNQGLKTQTHEHCHAHQDLVVERETGSEPTVDLHEWYSTIEGRAWVAANVSLPASFDLSAQNPIESFAEVCARYLTDPAQLRAEAPDAYAAFLEVMK